MAGQGPNIQFGGLNSVQEMVNGIKRVTDDLPRGVQQITQAMVGMNTVLESMTKNLDRFQALTSTQGQMVSGGGTVTPLVPAGANIPNQAQSLEHLKREIDNQLSGVTNLHAPVYHLPQSLRDARKQWESRFTSSVSEGTLNADTETQRRRNLREQAAFIAYDKETSKVAMSLLRGEGAVIPPTPTTVQQPVQTSTPVQPQTQPVSPSFGSGVYSNTERQIAGVSAVVFQKSHLNYDLVDASRVQAEAAKINKDMGQTGKLVSEAAKSTDPIISALGAELKTVIKGFQGVIDKQTAAFAEYNATLVKSKNGDAEATAQLAGKFTELQKATEELTGTNQKLNRTQDELKDRQPPPGGGDDGSGWGKIADKIGKSVASAITLLGSVYSAAKGVEVAAREEAVGKERGIYELKFAQQDLAARRTIESYDRTKPENILKYFGDIAMPGRSEFYGASGRERALGVARQELLDRLTVGKTSLERAQTQAIIGVVGGAATAATGLAMTFAGGASGVGALVTGQGLGLTGQGANQAVSALSNYYQQLQTNEVSQLGGGIAGTWAGSQVFGPVEAQRRARLNALKAYEQIQYDTNRIANEMQDRAVQSDPIAQMALSQNQMMIQAQQQGISMVGPYAWGRHEMLTALYGEQAVGTIAARPLGKTELGFGTGSLGIAKQQTKIDTYTNQLNSLSEARVKMLEELAKAGVEERAGLKVGHGVYDEYAQPSQEGKAAIVRSKQKESFLLENDRAARKVLIDAAQNLSGEGFRLLPMAIEDAKRLGVDIPVVKQTNKDYLDTLIRQRTRVGGEISHGLDAQINAQRWLVEAEQGRENIYAKEKETPVTRETAASRLGLTVPEFMMKSSMLTNVLGPGIQADVGQTEEMVKLSRAGFGSFEQLTGNMAALNQVTSNGQNNMKQLENILSIAVAAGFDKSRTSQMFMSATTNITDSLRLAKGETAASELASSIKYQRTGPEDTERAARRAESGIQQFAEFSTQREGWIGMVRQQMMLQSGATPGQMNIMLGFSSPKMRESVDFLAGVAKRPGQKIHFKDMGLQMLFEAEERKPQYKDMSDTEKREKVARALSEEIQKSDKAPLMFADAYYALAHKDSAYKTADAMGAHLKNEQDTASKLHGSAKRKAMQKVEAEIQKFSRDYGFQWGTYTGNQNPEAMAEVGRTKTIQLRLEKPTAPAADIKKRIEEQNRRFLDPGQVKYTEFLNEIVARDGFSHQLSVEQYKKDVLGKGITLTSKRYGVPMTQEFMEKVNAKQLEDEDFRAIKKQFHIDQKVTQEGLRSDVEDTIRNTTLGDVSKQVDDTRNMGPEQLVRISNYADIGSAVAIAMRERSQAEDAHNKSTSKQGAGE